MDRIYGRLDEAKAEIEKLKADLKCKVEFSDNFKCFRRLLLLEKLTGELDNHGSALENKETEIKELGMELKNCHSMILQLKLQNEEASTMILQVSYIIGIGNVRIHRFLLRQRNVYVPAMFLNPNHTEFESALYSKLIKLVYIKPGLTVDPGY
ncbi:hypothetical protein POTOM_020835 [Populus tomentosa]|uniref:Uncharacterized protein n=1 Tax=Populus tomentosa TaxID=118781 RepID=A0A8X7ZPE7_POPTO|nr:hypothetical protein POTOM_020835 [Populus tomentosa]